MLWQRFRGHSSWRLLLELAIVLAALRCIGEAYERSGPNGALLVSVCQGMLMVFAWLLLARIVRAWYQLAPAIGIVQILGTALIVLRLGTDGLMMFVLLADLIGMFALMGAFVAFVFCLFPLVFRRTVDPQLRLFPLLLLTYLPGLAFAVRIELHAMRQAIAQARPLVVAIHRYQTQHGAAPDDLDALVPDLLSEIPHPTLGADRRFGYRLDEDAWRLMLFGIDRMDLRMEYTGTRGGLPSTYGPDDWLVHR